MLVRYGTAISVRAQPLLSQAGSSVMAAFRDSFWGLRHEDPNQCPVGEARTDGLVSVLLALTDPGKECYSVFKPSISIPTQVISCLSATSTRGYLAPVAPLMRHFQSSAPI